MTSATAGDGDRRKVSTDALETLGSVISEQERRDAIHLAVEPTVAAMKLYPGQDVGVTGTTANPVGIVDPFLKAPVQPGERFWLVVYPRQIHSLRHVWTHPAFPDVPEVAGEMPKPHTEMAVSEQWIKDYAARIDVGYRTLMSAADDWIRSKEDGGWGDYFVQGGTLDTDPQFWRHYEIVRGVDVPEDAKTNFFSCSC